MTRHEIRPTRADRCERVLKILIDAQAGGMSLAEIKLASGLAGHELSLREVEQSVNDLAAQVERRKAFRMGVKVTLFSLKRQD